ncbi:DUF4190 domain-containing protein, partial [Kitasatospora sp. NPDC093806]|uniref:DUF4190 domain-containing protein n=1 Tax=Kitasatospora sp. NPDC093806 TaxID=3155075 RepID=UPI0034440FB4
PPAGPGPAAPAATGWAAVTPAAQGGFQPGFAYPGAPTVTNGFAIAALVTGLLCMWPLSLAFAIVALVQIPKRNEKGKGMAVTGLVFGVLGVIASLVAFIGLAALGFEERQYADQRRGPSGSISVNDLRTGDCFNQPPFSPGRKAESSSIYWVHVVPCSAPHHGEVAGSSNFPRGAAYPSASEIGKETDRLCAPVRDEYALDSWQIPDGMLPYFYYPSSEGWRTGDRRVTCTFLDEDAEHVGTVHTDRSKLTRPQLAYLDAVQNYNNGLGYQPEADVAEDPTAYRNWAKGMAAASRKEAAELSSTTTPWPDAVKPKLNELSGIQLEAANAWDAAAKAADPDAIEREVRKATALSGKSYKVAVEIRRELGLSTGEKVPDIRV